jgi:YEATS domain-containing protein 4
MSDSQAAAEPALKRARVEEAAAAAPVAAPAAAPVAIAAPAAAAAAAPIANGASSQQSAGTAAAAAAAAAAPTPAATADAVSTVRMPGVTVCCPLVFGSMAFPLGAAGDDMKTHKWTLYVRGADGEDISYFVSKVVFTLHPSFTPPTREVTKWPFELTEFGWGEFEAKITLHFKSPDEKHIDVVHPLRLYPDPALQLKPTDTVVSER